MVAYQEFKELVREIAEEEIMDTESDPLKVIWNDTSELSELALKYKSLHTKRT